MAEFDIKNADINKIREQKERLEGQILNLEKGPADQLHANEFASAAGQGPSLSKEAEIEIKILKKTVSKLNSQIGRIQRVANIERTIFPNELEEFNSVNHMFGLYCLTTDEILDPDNTYMGPKGEPEVVVIKSGGGTRAMGERKAQTSLEKAGGRVEYFMDDVFIESVIGYNSDTRAMQMHKGGFSVTEPYSMGQFFETLQVAAVMAGHLTYTFATFLLTVEFVGYTADNQMKRLGKRQIPIKITESTMAVTASGTVYETTFISANSSANSDSVQKIPSDIQIVGGNLQEVLQSGIQSLTTVLNTNLLKREEGNKKEFADQYIILFPPGDALESRKLATKKEDDATVNDLTDQERVETLTGQSQSTQIIDYEAFLEKIAGVSVKRSDLGEAIVSQSLATGNMNEIGLSSLVTDKLQNTTIQPAGHPSVYDKEKDVYEQKANYIPEGKRAFKFEKGTKINNIIEELVLSSEYGKNLLDQKLVDGFRPWFSILPMVFQVPVKEVEASKGRPPFIYVFKVIPYEVHASTWMGPGDVTPEQPIDHIAKEYNYLYTGKNKNVLEFDLTFNNRYLTPIPRDGGADTETAQNDGNAATSNSEDKTQVTTNNEGDATPKVAPLKSVIESDIEIITSGMRAVPSDSKEVIARTFHKALVYSMVDLVKVELQIMGDPYYISDSGTGNYMSAQGSTWFADENGHIDHVRSQQFIELNFKTPYDYSPSSSTIEFPVTKDEGGGVKIRQFSGLYKVTYVKSEFNQGKFIQTLSMLRMNTQTELDYKKNKEPDSANVGGGQSYSGGYKDRLPGGGVFT
tara:strand:+ start:4856 stop:7267 length:2412 start_codon:yes stop_codon:yes gene_type:complete